MSQKLTLAEARAIVDAANSVDYANVLKASVDRPPEVQKLTLDLSVARDRSTALKINFPFRSVFLQSATDALAIVSILPNSIDSFQDAIPLSLRDAFVFPKQQSEGYLINEAQPNKKVDLFFFVTGEFRSGSQIQLQSGGIAIIDGTSAADTALSTTAGGTIQLFAANPSRKKGTVQNETGGSIWVGPLNTVTKTGATRGFQVKPNEVFYWRNTAALYAYTDALSTNNLIVRSES